VRREENEMSQVALTMVVLVFPILTIWAAVTDFMSMTIANRISLGLAAAGLLALVLGAPSWEAFGGHFAAAGLVFAVGFTCFAMGWMGGGDVKFATAVALWLGWGHLLDYAVTFSVFGGLLTLLALFSDRVLDPLPALKVGFLARFQEHRRVPYGVALSAAALQIFPETVWMRVFA
jgi:prepilin peptidase CpaA